MKDLSMLPDGFVPIEEALKEMYPIWSSAECAECEDSVRKGLSLYQNGELVAISRESLDKAKKDVLDYYNNEYNLRESNVNDLGKKLDVIYDEENRTGILNGEQLKMGI